MGNLKDIGIYVGDNVNFVKDEYSNNYTITGVEERLNQITRPKVCNIEQLIIVIAPKPKPDLLLVDKLIINAKMHNIKPILLINKIDLADDDFISDINNQYSKVLDVVFASAQDNNNIDAVKEILKNKTSVFAGQSAVGKSSLLNAIDPNIKQSTNILSKKVERGKHTTRECTIFLLDNNILIADTPGFSMLELNISHKELKDYYTEFENIACKFNDCQHIKELGCKVIEGGQSVINDDRRERYITLYNKLKEVWDREYD